MPPSLRLIALALCAAVTMLVASLPLPAQTAPDKSAPPTGGGFFPLGEVHRGLTGTAWTVFTGEQAGADGSGDSGRAARRARPRPRHDPGPAARRQARVHRRGGRHERQPGLHRQPAAGLALLPHRPVQQGPHRRHHAHRADAGGARPADQKDQGPGICNSEQGSGDQG